MSSTASAEVVTRVERFDPEHVYRDQDAHVWPSVTQILGAVPPWLGRFDHIPPDRLEYKRQLGSAVHQAIALDAEGDLDEGSVDPAVLPYLIAWRRYQAESGFVARWTERVIWSGRHGYAGTLDALGVLPDGRKLLVDAKTGSPVDAPLAGPQTAAYLEAAREAGLAGADGVVYRASVHLRDDETYRVMPHTSREDWSVFLAALQLFRFQARVR